MTTRDEIATIVRGAIAEVLAVEPDEVGDECNLEEDFRIDSLELMEIGTKLEVALAIRLTPADLFGLPTVGAAIDLLHRRQEVTA